MVKYRLMEIEYGQKDILSLGWWVILSWEDSQKQRSLLEQYGGLQRGEVCARLKA